jgi:pre-mRNA-processing factor 19
VLALCHFHKSHVLLLTRAISSHVMQELNAVRFDNSGSYVAVVGDTARVFASKTGAEIATWDAHKSTITGVAFGTDAKSIVTVSKDRAVKVYQ